MENLFGNIAKDAGALTVTLESDIKKALKDADVIFIMNDGKIAGVAAIFSTADECGGVPVYSAFNPKDLPDYQSYPQHKCPICKSGRRIDAMVNTFGYSKM